MHVQTSARVGKGSRVVGLVVAAANAIAIAATVLIYVYGVKYAPHYHDGADPTPFFLILLLLPVVASLSLTSLLLGAIVNRSHDNLDWVSLSSAAAGGVLIAICLCSWFALF